MLFRTHLFFGILVFFAVQGFLDFSKWILFFSIVLGAVIVDIDTKKSRVGKAQGLRVFQLFVEHRGFFHTIFAGVLISFAIFWVSKGFSVGFFIGYLSHLILDASTKSGVALFWPVSKRKFGLWLRTGGLVEDVIFLAILLGDIHLFLKGVLLVGIM